MMTPRTHLVPSKIFNALVGALLLLNSAQGWALQDDADQPIHITGKSAKIDQVKQTLVYKGDVRIDQGSLRVVADEMVVVYENERVVKIVATGTPARYQQELAENQGHVRANAQTIVYHTQDEALDLEGKARLLQHGNELSGERIRYDIVKGKVDAAAENKGPVRMILQPARMFR